MIQHVEGLQERVTEELKMIKEGMESTMSQTVDLNNKLAKLNRLLTVCCSVTFLPHS
jgi:hypothetical protein